MTRLLAFLSRTPRVLYALWLVVAMTQPTGVHACPVHDRVVAEAMAAHGMAMRHAMPDSHGGHPSEQCHCLGDCSTGMATPLPSSPTSIPAPATVVAVRGTLEPVEHSFENPTRLLPPSTAPPAALIA